MKLKQQHKTILIVKPQFSSDVKSEENFILLQNTYKKYGIEVHVISYNIRPSYNEIQSQVQNQDAVLLIGDAKCYPKNALKFPFIKTSENKNIPIAWLPIRNSEDLFTFSKTINEVHGRKQDQCAVALLSQKHPRFTRIVDRMATILNAPSLSPYKWSSNLLLRESMIEGLESGLGLATYFGHGRPIGWVGYYGLRSHHFENKKAKPVGALLSLCCKTASRKNTAISFCEQLVLDGKTAVSFGAVDSTLHTDNTRWSVGITKALLSGANTIAELIVQATPKNLSSYTHYRLIGDPLAPIYSTKETALFANNIKTYP
ncbi:C25 family cysteine peptidase [Oceanihabitans sp. 2_MG-2023]|uniref:C25 family cysteine peptidase n=1 Tax=Oceanihabitans sp. 2_MG-2023 TaxID=3062661 RepID=UPI0026E34247|nr:C25 family cysteine peptidase [Oceanihabitans sp. 2_MG-2023]MDO6597974.1 C25 family cysteine peptidase [Oceanihabitans sp. 2_MG-2023]